MTLLRCSHIAGVLVAATLAVHVAAQQPPLPTALDRDRSVSTPRLYVFDCGAIRNVDTAGFGFAAGAVARPHVAVPCHLVVHPRGTLIWDTGIVPDAEIGTPAVGAERARKPLRQQLAAIGYAPADITFLALSHYHFDHTANANMFSGSTWLVRQEERAVMFAESPPTLASPNTYRALKNSKTIILDKEEYDVFGDGTVVLKSAPGHSPGHQVLFVKLAKTGPVLLAGDLYHFPEQRGTELTPPYEFSKEQTLKSRTEVEAYVKRTGAALWIGHDFWANARLRKSPAYYE